MSKIQGNRSRHGDYEIWSRYDGRQYFGREQAGEGLGIHGFLRFPSAEQAAPQRIPSLRVCARLADDDTDTCLNVSKMLRMIGMRSDWTTSGHEAVVRTQDAIEQG